jgi:hypothetical protein
MGQKHKGCGVCKRGIKASTIRRIEKARENRLPEAVKTASGADRKPRSGN